MLPLKASAFPDSAEALRQALTAGFTEGGLTPREITVDAPGYPRIERLKIDLTGGSVGEQAPDVKPGAPLGGALQVGSLELDAKPLIVRGAPVQLELRARDAELRELSAQGIDRLLSLQRAAEGRVSAQIQPLDLQRLILVEGQKRAREHGADLQDVKLNLNAINPRTLELTAEVVAKFGFVKATVRLTGRATVDDALMLHLSDLEVKGSGMAGSLATGFIRPQLEKLAQHPIALSSRALGEIKVRDVRVSTGDSLRIEADFGS